MPNLLAEGKGQFRRNFGRNLGNESPRPDEVPKLDIRAPEGDADVLAGRLRVGPTPAVRGFRRRADDAIGQYRLFANPIALRLAVIRTAGYP